ncbi:MAG: hypothetical protein D3924_05225 [Candidatus Electrothrix sp. AR4]|nr:hypothetical protein [Candidatus Electrothrix sp. AR4]
MLQSAVFTLHKDLENMIRSGTVAQSPSMALPMLLSPGLSVILHCLQAYPAAARADDTAPLKNGNARRP